MTVTKTRTDEALFILMLLGVTIFQTLIIIRPWAAFTRDLMIDTGTSYDSVRFILFVIAALSPVLIYSIAIGIPKLLNRRIGFKDLFTGYAYSAVPLGLMMHLSHNYPPMLFTASSMIFDRNALSGLLMAIQITRLSLE